MKNLFPFLPLKTERLIMKQTSPEDIELILKMDKQKDTQAYLGGIKEYTRQERINFLKRKAEHGSLTVYLHEQPIGFIGLKEKENSVELSYIFDSDYWHHGYCEEACQKLLQVAQEELDIFHIIANTKEENKNSIKVLEKLGFTKKKINSKDEFIEYEIFKEREKND